MYKTVNDALRRAFGTGPGRRMAVIGLLGGAILGMAAASGPYATERTFTVVLDAGHGGKDPGNLGTGRHPRTEKDIALEVALAVGNYIESQHPDVQVVYTRKSDTFPTLKERVGKANDCRADLFISIHCNANDNKGAYGAETFVMGLHKSEESLQTAMRENASIFLEENHKQDYAGFDPRNPDTYIALSLRENVFLEQSLQLAKGVQDQFRARVGRKDRGVKQAGYYVISFTNMPSVLVELGFLTNSEEEDFLHSSEGKSYMSSAIYRAFRDYRSRLGNQAGPESPPVPSASVVSVSGPAADPAPPAGIVWRDVPSGVRFQIQFLSSPRKLPARSPEFKGIDKVEEYFSNGAYRYLAGRTASFREAKSMQDEVRKMGFGDAFIVAFENDKRISLDAALEKMK